jgi:DHA2 family multidrug resistance protein
LLTRREQFHQSRLVETAQQLHSAYPDYVNHLAGTLGSTPDSATTLANIYQGIISQATLLSYLEDFKVLGLVFLGLLPLLLFVKGGKGGPGAATAH